jgi:hypothetical protein
VGVTLGHTTWGRAWLHLPSGPAKTHPGNGRVHSSRDPGPAQKPEAPPRSTVAAIVLSGSYRQNLALGTTVEGAVVVNLPLVRSFIVLPSTWGVVASCPLWTVPFGHFEWPLA